MRRALLIAATLLVPGCTPELGDVPFACSADGSCPEGYACQSTVCVREGAAAGPARPARVKWINAGEMHWVGRPGGGAALVVNDGFTPGARGLYEILVSPDGSVGEPRLLYGYGDELPIASSVAALDDARYVVAMLRFPRVDEDAMSLEVLAIGRESASSVETLYREQEPFLGGVEPPYLGLSAGQGAIDVAWARPSAGGRVEVLRVERDGSVWNRARAGEQPLPAEILPLSGDCALWRSGEDELTVRVGFEAFALGRVDAAGQVSALELVDGVPLYAAGGEVLEMRYGDYDEGAGAYAISFARLGADLAELDEVQGGVLQAALEPYTGTPYQGGALIAPLSDDASFSTLHVGFWSPGAAAPARVATVTRSSTNDLYSARAFADGGTAYLAWTEFHESLMDLWVATAPLSGAP